MTVIYGRRRIGKSTLIKEFIKNKRAVYYTATKAGINKIIELWGKQALAVLAPEMNTLSFQTINDLLDFLGKHSERERTVIVIDELPYLAEADKSVLSVLQNYIDNHWMHGQMFLILCGSSVSFMENEVLSEKSPIFGRRSVLELRAVWRNIFLCLMIRNLWMKISFNYFSERRAICMRSQIIY